MIKNFFVLILVISQLISFGQKGKVFPVMKGISLSGNSVSVPWNNGKYSIVAIAYHRGAEDDLKQWLNPLFNSFIKVEGSSGGGFDMADVYDVNFVFVPMIAGFKRVADDFKKGTDKQFWQYILDTEKTDVNALKDQLEVTDTKVPYFYVLDEQGKVVEVQSGKFSQTKLDKLEEAVQ